jgi:hypothetical protein
VPTTRCQSQPRALLTSANLAGVLDLMQACCSRSMLAALIFVRAKLGAGTDGKPRLIKHQARWQPI